MDASFIPALARIASNTSVPRPWPIEHRGELVGFRLHGLSMAIGNCERARDGLCVRARADNHRDGLAVRRAALHPSEGLGLAETPRELGQPQDGRIDVAVHPIARRPLSREGQDAFERGSRPVVVGQARREAVYLEVARDARDRLRSLAQGFEVIAARVERGEHLGFNFGEHLAVDAGELLQRRAQGLHVGLAVGRSQKRSQVDEQDLVRVAGLEEHVAHVLGRLTQPRGPAGPFRQVENHGHQAACGLERVCCTSFLADLGQELGDAFEDLVLVLVDGYPTKREAVWVLQALVDVEVGESGHEHAILVDGDVSLVGE